MNLFAIAKALGVDDITSPTIPFVPPAGTITGVPTITAPVTGASISLKADVVSLDKGSETDVSVSVFSNSEEIKSLKFTIAYDTNVFEVVDSNTTVQNIQINYLNTFFVSSVNSVDKANGLIRVEASSQTGAATLTNMVVAKIKVRAIKDGIGEFSIVKQESSLKKADQTNVLVATQGVNLIVGEGTITASPTTVNYTDMVKPTFGRTPDTALFDTPGSISAVVGGLFLIITGFYLYKKKDGHDLQR